MIKIRCEEARKLVRLSKELCAECSETDYAKCRCCWRYWIVNPDLLFTDRDRNAIIPFKSN